MAMYMLCYTAQYIVIIIQSPTPAKEVSKALVRY